MLSSKQLQEFRAIEAPNCPCGQKAHKALQVLLNEVTMNMLAFEQIKNVLARHNVEAVTVTGIDLSEPLTRTT